MKKFFHLASFVALFAFAFSACKKDDIIQPPTPVPSNVFQFAVDSLPGLTAPASEMFAVVSIVNSRNEAVITDKKLSLQHTSRFLTEKQDLPAGTYKLTKFFVVNGDQVAKYVTPVAGSVKAAAIQKPLAISFSLPQSTKLVQTVEVLKVDESLREESYGYAYGSFRQVTIEPEVFIKVKVKARVQVGTVVYDSIPAAFTLTSWDRNGQMHRKDTQLAAGAQEIALPASHLRYQFRMTKWGVTDEETVDRTGLQEGTLYVLGGSKEARKLRTEITYIFRNGVYVPKSKIQYLYDGNMLSNIYYYESFPGNTAPVMTMQDIFHYNGNKLSSIERFDADEVPNRLGAQTIQYDGPGRIIGVDVHYPMTDFMNVGTRAIMDITYNQLSTSDRVNVKVREEPNGVITKHHAFKFVKGNKREAVTIASTFQFAGLYTYDFGINPYVHMVWPDEMFGRTSKNNVASADESTLTSSGDSIASLDTFQYQYNADGYPTERIRANTLTNQPLLKTVYSY